MTVHRAGEFKHTVPTITHMSDRDTDNRIRYYQASNAFLRAEIGRLLRLVEQLEQELEKSYSRKEI